MNMLKTIESTIAGVLEGAFGRVFRSEVRPVELARKLAREMDQHRTESLSHVYAPNEFSVWLSPRDRARYEGVEAEVIDELCAYLLEHARREDLILTSAPRISFHTDPRLALGEFGIQAQPARSSRAASAAASPARESSARAQPAASVPGSEPPPPVAEGGSSQTMIYSTSARVRGNGVTVTGSQPIESGDRIELGSTELVFELA